MATIITKNSSTPSSVPTAGDLEQGELAVNVADKRLFTEDSTGSVVELGTNPSSLTTSTVDIDGGTIDGAVIGGTTPAAVSGTTGTFSGALSATSGTFTAGIISNFAFPQWNLIQDTAPADEGRYRIIGIGEQLRIQTLSDAGAVGGNAYAISRSGTDITSITYGNATDDPDHTFEGNVGIGTTPGTPLDVLANSSNAIAASWRGRSSDDQVRVRAVNNAGSAAHLTHVYTANQVFTVNSSNTEIYRFNNSGLSLDGGSNYQIDSDGNINVSSLLGFSRQDQTISSGAITVTGSYYRLDTEGGAATDDLDTINGGNIGDIVILTTTVNTRDIVVKDNTGNLNLGADFTLDRPTDFVVLLKNSATQWSALLTRSN